MSADTTSAWTLGLLIVFLIVFAILTFAMIYYVVIPLRKFLAGVQETQKGLCAQFPDFPGCKK